MTLHTKDRLTDRGSLSNPYWELDDVELVGFNEVAMTMAVIPYEQYHVNKNNCWFYYRMPSYNSVNAAFHIRNGNYSVQQNVEHIASIIKTVDPSFQMSYDKEQSQITMTSDHEFTIDNLSKEVFEAAETLTPGLTCPQPGIFKENIVYNSIALTLFGLTKRGDAIHTNGKWVVKSDKPATNGRLRCVYISSDMCRYNMKSNQGSTDYSDIVAVAPVLTEPLEELMWQSQRPLYIHLPTIPAEVGIRLTDEHGNDVIIKTDWIVQFSFRKNPRKTFFSWYDKIYEVLKYIALK